MKYIQIYQELRCNIQNDIYQEGEKLPSLRQLSKTYQVSLDTIKKAISLLEEEHLIYPKDRSGFYVLQKEKIKPENTLTTTIDFGSSRSNAVSFPYSDFLLCLKKATENYKEEFFKYGQSQGLPELIQTLKKWFEKNQLFIKEENLFITTGIQQALFILSKLTFPNQKETILIELPSYHLMLDLLELEKILFQTIERNENGLDWELLETYFRDNDIKFFYTTPRISSPLGLSFSEIEKKRLLKLANQYDVYLVEDDYLGDFISTTTNLPLHFYDTNERVIYLKSFSKIMFPGLRIGACLLPSVLREAFIKYRTILEVDSSMFSQAALNLYIKTGMFDEYIKDTRLIQLSRDQAFINQGKKTPELFDLSLFETGKSFITLPRDVSTSLFENHLQEENIKLEDIRRNVPNNYKCQNKIYTIELLQLTPSQITKGIATIQNVYQKSKRKLSD